MSIPTTFELDRKYVNATGAWVRLRIYQHPSNFYHVYGFDYWAPDFAEDITEAESTTNMNRARIERSMRNWLRKR